MAKRKVDSELDGKMQGKDVVGIDSEQLSGDGAVTGNQEKVPDTEQLLGEGTATGNQEKVPDTEQLSGDGKQAKCMEVEKKKTYEITCRNQITKSIGGVDFENGIGHTRDDYAASWFASKDGYTVRLME